METTKSLLLIVGVIIAAQWYKQRNSNPPASAVDTGMPSCQKGMIPIFAEGVLDGWMLPDSVPQTSNCHITEAAYHVNPATAGYTAAIGTDTNSCGGVI